MGAEEKKLKKKGKKKEEEDAVSTREQIEGKNFGAWKKKEEDKT